LINFLQSANTVLLNDEAYYWVYSRFLDWGYFDHPPMIAVLIKAGYALFHNELGVRFFIVLLNTFTLLCIYKLLPRPNSKLFYGLVFSMALLQVGGFIAVPDIPLIFFTALFFLVYKHFAQKATWANTILLGVVMACMFYSKYHAVLIVLFTLFSNVSLFKNYKAYVSVLIAAILFTPHLMWQYQHGFPSVQYHLYERNETSYRFSYTWEYIAGQLLLAGPLAGWLLFWASAKYKPTDHLERALKFCFAGIYIFFLITSYKGRVEANWTVPALIPLIILSHQYLSRKQKLQNILFVLAPITLVLVFALRFYLASDNKFIKTINTNEFEQNKTWAKQVQSLSGYLPVVFINTYQKPSKLWFYGGTPSFSLNTPSYRRNNYNYWPVEKSFQGKTVYAMSGLYVPGFNDSISTKAGMLYGKKVDSFYSFSGVQIQANKPPMINAQHRIKADVIIKNDLGFNLDLSKNSLSRPGIMVFDKDQVVFNSLLTLAADLYASNSFHALTDSAVHLAKGNYNCRLYIPSAIVGKPSLNSTNIVLKVE
jgi:hypothetical protein